MQSITDDKSDLKPTQLADAANTCTSNNHNCGLVTAIFQVNLSQPVTQFTFSQIIFRSRYKTAEYKQVSKVNGIQQFVIEITTPLREITCHMGSHQAAVTFLHFPQQNYYYYYYY